MRCENPEAKGNQKTFIGEKHTKPNCMSEPPHLSQIFKLENFSKVGLSQLLECKRAKKQALNLLDNDNCKRLEEERISKIYSKHFYEEADKFQQANNELYHLYQSRPNRICSSTRKVALENIVQFIYEQGLSNSTLFLMQRLFDIYLLKNWEDFEHLESKLSWYIKTCSTCLLIASKNEDRYPVNIKKLIKYLKDESYEIEGR